MKNLFFVFVLLMSINSCQQKNNPKGDITIDLTQKWDTLRVLDNPHKGWYHHLLDNGISKYL